MFKWAKAFNQDINGWDVSSVTNMRYMFWEAIAFNQNLNSWDVSSVKDMGYMFKQAAKFDGDISDWDVSSVEGMSEMFMYVPFNQDIGGWDVSNVSNMERMFFGANAFNKDISSWSVENVGNMQYMFYNSSAFNQDLSNWCVYRFDTEPSNFSTYASNWVLPKPNWGTCPSAPAKITLLNPSNEDISVELSDSLVWLTDSNSTSYQLQIFDDNGSTLTDTTITDTTFYLINTVLPETKYFWKVKGISNLDFDLWSDLWSFTTAPPKFYLKDNGITILCPEAEISESGIINGITYTKRSKDQITSENASTTCTSGITDMIGLFQDEYTFNEDISHWDVSNVSNIGNIFRRAINFNQNLEAWDVSNVTHMSGAFRDAESFNSPLNDWDVSSVEKMTGMFYGATSFNQELNDWDVSNVTTIAGMFRGATLFNQPLDKWNTSNITSFGDLFYGAETFNQPLNSWDLSSATNIYAMFERATSFNQPLNTWDTRNISRIGNFLYLASSFNQNLSAFKLYNITSSSNFLKGTKIANKYFSEMLNNWANDDSTSFFVELDLGSTYNQDAIEARQKLIDYFRWTITDGGLVYYPDSLELISPAQNEIGVSTTPKLTWKCSGGNGSSECYTFRLQLSSDSLFNDTVIDSSGYFQLHVDENYYWLDVKIPLDFITDYYWRLKGSNDAGTSDWSKASSFTTRKQLEVNNLAIINEDSLHVTDHKPTFKYEYISGDGSAQNSYQFQVTTDSLFETITHWDSGFIETDSTIFSYSGDSLIDGSTYYSRLRITTDLDSSSWEELIFRMNSTPSIPILATPSNNYLFKLDDEISLQVNEVTDAEGDSIQYYFELYNVTNDVIETESDLITSSVWTVNTITTKEENMSYSWLVRSYDGFEYSGYSDKNYFHINDANESPSSFNLVSNHIVPEEDTDAYITVEFTWENAIDPDPLDTVNYKLYLGSEIKDLTAYEIGKDTLTTISGLKDNATYYWKVDALDLNGSMVTNNEGYKEFKINSSNQAPTIPRLITPTDSSVEITTKPYFEWAKSSDIDNDTLSYVLHVESTMVANDLIGFVTNPLIQPNFTSKIKLADNHHFAWYVSVSDGDTTIYSEPFTFWVNTELEPPSPFELISPSNNEQLTTTRPTFNWNKSIDNDPNDYAKYTLVISKDSLFTDVVLEQMTSIDTTYTPEVDMLNNAKYYWKVIATDTDSLITESKTLAFILGDLSVSNESESVLPDEYQLSQNYPNPFNPSTQIQYALPEATEVTLEVFNSVGQKVMELVNGQQSAGYHTATFDATGLSSGVYLYKLTTPSFTETKKMLLIK